MLQLRNTGNFPLAIRVIKNGKEQEIMAYPGLNTINGDVTLVTQHSKIKVHNPEPTPVRVNAQTGGEQEAQNRPRYNRRRRADETPETPQDDTTDSAT